MNVIVIASIVVAVTLLVGALLAIIFFGFSRAVTREQAAIESEKGNLNPNLTMGYAIPVSSDYDEQLAVARQLAAKNAAKKPRGANMRIGSLDDDKQPTAFDGINDDPLTAVRIARYHGWQGLKTGAQAGPSVTTAAKAPAQAAPPTKGIDDLVPGVDYEYIEITDSMSPAEKRKARIANAKAKSAAVKKLKSAAVAPAASPTQTASTAAAQPAAVQASPSAAVSEPVAGVDYEVIEITDDMSADEVRKARIANAKAKSAAMKAFKESGATVAAAQPTAESTAPPAAISEPVAGVDYEVIEITDDMSADEVRKARIANAKAKSAAMKAFKDSGGVVAAPAPAAESAVPEVRGTGEVETETAQASPDTAGIPKPEYITVTEDMDASEVRQARIQNAKAKSAYNKALKAAGIDPKTVEE